LNCARYHSAVKFVNGFPSQLVGVDVVVVARRLKALLVFDCSAKAEEAYVCLGQQVSFVVLIVLICSDLAVCIYLEIGSVCGDCVRVALSSL
jgi:hypothetical protein